jgi:hypothetical protein
LISIVAFHPKKATSCNYSSPVLTYSKRKDDLGIFHKWSDLDIVIRMNATLLKALLALVPACMLFAGSVVFFFTRKTVGSFLQVIGAGCLVGVVLTHIFEALRLFAWMHWGLEHSVGHYLDFWSAVLGLTLFPVGYLLHALARQG